MSDIRNARDALLAEARKNVTGERDIDYGGPEGSFDTIAELWNAYCKGADIKVTFTSSDVAAMLALLKIARVAANPYYKDGWVDLAGYAACGAEVAGVYTKEDLDKLSANENVKVVISNPPPYLS